MKFLTTEIEEHIKTLNPAELKSLKDGLLSCNSFLPKEYLSESCLKIVLLLVGNYIRVIERTKQGGKEDGKTTG